MHMKPRGSRAALYRSQWIPRSAVNTHGYTEQRFVGSIRLDATEVPNELCALLTSVEAEWLETTLCAPNRTRQADALAAATARENDPCWRLVEAVRLIQEAAERSVASPVPRKLADNIRTVTAGLRHIEPPLMATTSAIRFGNPVDAVVQAARHAAKTIAQPDFPKAPEAGARSSPVYKSWLELSKLMDGNAHGSLLRTLQAAGYVKKKGLG